MKKLSINQINLGYNAIFYLYFFKLYLKNEIRMLKSIFFKNNLQLNILLFCILYINDLKF